MDDRSEQNRRQISGWFYALPAVVVIIGFIGFGAYLYINIMSLAASMTQLSIPGGHYIDLDTPDEYIVFHEYRSVLDGRIYSSEQPLAGLGCSLESSSGQGITLVAPTGNYKYSIGERSGRSVYKFVIDKPGRYFFACSYENGASGPEAILSIGQGFLTELLRVILGGMTLVATSILVAAGVFVFILMKRRKGSKKLSGEFPGKES